MLAIQAGLTPGIADQNALAQNVPIIHNNDEDEDDELLQDVDDGEGDGFAGALYSGSRFRGVQNNQNMDQQKVGKLNLINDDYKEIAMENKPPPPAFSDFEDDDNDEQHFGDIDPSQNQNYGIEAGKVKNVAAKLAIDPTAMLPGNKGPPKQKKNEEE